jgi:hypothetical protein
VISSISFEPKNIQAGDSEPLSIQVRAGSRVAGIRGILRNASGTARLPFACSPRGESAWNCRVTVPSCAACGRWKIESLKISRPDGTLDVPASHRVLSTASANISAPRCDNAPPVVNVVNVSETDADTGEVILTFSVADGYCGVGALSGTVVSPHGQRLSFTGAEGGDENIWSARLKISGLNERGSWKVASIEVSDVAGNTQVYSATDLVLKDAVFVVR